MKTHHFIIIGAALVLLSIGGGVLLGRASKQCPVYPSTSILSDSIRSQFEEAYLQKERDLRDIYTAKEDSAARAYSRRPTKQQAQDAYRHLVGISNDSLADGMLATPVVPHIDD